MSLKDRDWSYEKVLGIFSTSLSERMSIFSPLLVENLSHRFVPQEIFASTELPTTKDEELRHGRNIALYNY
jgi:hypothetical protein